MSKASTSSRGDEWTCLSHISTLSFVILVACSTVDENAPGERAHLLSPREHVKQSGLSTSYGEGEGYIVQQNEFNVETHVPEAPMIARSWPGSTAPETLLRTSFCSACWCFLKHPGREWV